MDQFFLKLYLYSYLFLLANCSAATAVDKRSFNVLFILVDDMRHLPETELIHIPNILQLAGTSAFFKNTFAQQALCAPSRNSLLTGRRPDTLHLYDFNSYWRHVAGNFTTLPQYFKENGYQTQSIGKIFHPGQSSNYSDDYPYSWSSPPYHPPSEIYKDAATCNDSMTQRLQSNLLCPVDVKSQPRETLPDIEIYEEAVKYLTKKQLSKPYFLAVGFHKPHIPLKFPIEYLEHYPISTIKPVPHPTRPWDMPAVAWHPWTDIRHRDDIQRLNIPFPYGTMPFEWALKVKQNYYAAWSYLDDLIGKLLRYVDRNQTAIILTSDHGWSLGENGLWAKYSNYDNALKVPLIISIPGIKPKTIQDPVELVDLFPTLVDICKLPTVHKCIDNKQILCVEGKSIMPLVVNNQSQSPKNNFNALSQYPRPSLYPKPNSDKPHLKSIRIMGYSIRTSRFRYTEWIKFDNKKFFKNWTKVYAVELYDHTFDNNESINLSKRSELKNITASLSILLRSYFT